MSEEDFEGKERDSRIDERLEKQDCPRSEAESLADYLHDQCSVGKKLSVSLNL